MATFTVQNLSGTRFGVPEPVAKVLNAGETVEIDAASLDTDAIAALINAGLIGIIPQAGGSAGADAVESAPKSNAGLMTATILSVTVGAAATMTFTHGLGVVPYGVLVFDDVAGEPAAEADFSVGGTVNTVTVTNDSVGSLDFNIVMMFPAGTAPLGAEILATDARIAVA